ncbi:MAG TPA: helix-turn-helix transcriptional regulator [Dermatophilaceae bacterium]|nr:helix-turn-helix transcriptional regulator [Dermatophilaceae bacterium]
MAPLAPAIPRMHDLGGYLREQRELAQLSVRQLSAVTGISNPYLSQIERGLKRPSAEILKALAQGLRLSAESLYVRAGLLDPESDLAASAGARGGGDARAALRSDPHLDDDQRRALLDLYDSFVRVELAGAGPEPAAKT